MRLIGRLVSNTVQWPYCPHYDYGTTPFHRANLNWLLTLLQTVYAHVIRIYTHKVKYQVMAKSWTHWGRGKWPTFLQTFPNARTSMKVIGFWLNFHWSLFSKVQWTTCQPVFVQMPACYRTGHELLSEPMTAWFTDEYASVRPSELTLWGLATPYGDMELGQHWLR